MSRARAIIRLLRWIVPLAVLAALASCASIGYYAQSIGGQVQLLGARRPVGDVLSDPTTSEALRERLALVQRIRAFASAELGLPDNGSYRDYADLERPYVVWNVFATAALSITPQQWCFPIAGCVSYRGYFDERQARAFAAGLAEQGLDVFVAGVPAYSTLGWFDDPVLNTFIHYPPAELARLIFHELAHQVVYVRDDTVFNESFAVAVELEGVQRWLAAHGTAAERAAFDRARAARAAFGALAAQYRDKLAHLYRSDASNAVKQEGKRRIFGELAAEYARLKATWKGYSGYDRWLGEAANNASLASIGVYSQKVPAFQALLAREGGDLGRFYVAVRALSAHPRAARDALLAELAGEDVSARVDPAPLAAAR